MSAISHAAAVSAGSGWSPSNCSRRRRPIVPPPDPADVLAWAQVFHARRLLAAGQRMATMHSTLRRLARHEHPAVAEAARRTLAQHRLSLGLEVRS